MVVLIPSQSVPLEAHGRLVDPKSSQRFRRGEGVEAECLIEEQLFLDLRSQRARFAIG